MRAKKIEVYRKDVVGTWVLVKCYKNQGLYDGNDDTIMIGNQARVLRTMVVIRRLTGLERVFGFVEEMALWQMNKPKPFVEEQWKIIN